MEDDNTEETAGLENLVKVFFELEPGEWHGFCVESLWAEFVSYNQYKIRNIPFYAKGVSFEDVINVREVDGNLEYQSTGIPSGNSTYRILVEREKYDNGFLMYWTPLETMGCSYESGERDRGLILAVDVPPDADVHAVFAQLEKGENEELWSFEEGHCGHKV